MSSTKKLYTAGVTTEDRKRAILLESLSMFSIARSACISRFSAELCIVSLLLAIAKSRRSSVVFRTCIYPIFPRAGMSKSGWLKRLKAAQIRAMPEPEGEGSPDA
jgi:hypothetical protein